MQLPRRNDNATGFRFDIYAMGVREGPLSDIVPSFRQNICEPFLVRFIQCRPLEREEEQR
jgi:hypothetical protein